MGCTSFNIASGNNFQLYFPVLPFSTVLQDSKDLTLNLFNTIIPSMSFDSTPISWQGWDTKRADGNLIFTDFTFDFMVDESFKNWSILFDWMSKINNNKDRISGHPYGYTTDGFIMINDNFGKSVLKLKLINCFPMDLGAVTLSYREGETYLECNATISYDRLEKHIDVL